MRKKVKFLIFFVMGLAVYEISSQHRYIIQQNIDVSGNDLGMLAIYDLQAGSNNLFHDRQPSINAVNNYYFTSSSPISFATLSFGSSSAFGSCSNTGGSVNSNITASPCSPPNFSVPPNQCINVGVNYFRFFELPEFNSLNDTSRAIGYCEQQTLKVLNGSCIVFNYAIEYSLDGNFNNKQELLSFDERFESFTFNPADISGLLPNQTITFWIRYIENVSNNGADYSDPVVYDVISCSPSLVPERSAMKNATCLDEADGNITLTFDQDVDPNFRMRYFVYDANANLSFDPEKENPPQSSEQEVLGGLIAVNDGTGYFSGALPVGLGAGVYKIVYQEFFDAGNGADVIVKSGGVTQPFTIEQPSKIDPSATITQAQCNENTAQINFSAIGGNDMDSSGTYSYQYQLNGDGNWITSDSNSQDVPLTLTEQTVKIKAIYSVGDCESEEITLLDKIEAIVPPLTFTNPNHGMVTSSSVSDGVISINYDGGTPNYTFQLSKQNEVISVFETVSNPTIIDNPFSKRVEFRNLSIGTYRITITDKDGSGCSLTTESLGDIVVGTTPLPVLGTEEVIPISCTNTNSGVLSVNVSGGVTPYNYQWTINGIASPAQTTEVPSISLNNLSEPGEYILKVASNGFIDFDDISGYVITTLILDPPVQVLLEKTTITNISCHGAQDGSVLVDASGATTYEYKLDAFDDWQQLNGNIIPITAGGMYDLYLRNSENGCEAVPLIDALLVEEPDPINVLESTNNTATNNGFEGSISLVINGGTPFASALNPYTISWTKEIDANIAIFEDTDLSTPYSIVNLESAIYQATIRDANGCVFLQSFEIIEPGELTATLAQSVFLECNDDDFAELIANVQGGTAPYEFEWFQIMNGNNRVLSENSDIIGNLSDGIYFVRVSDTNGISIDSESINIVQPDALDIVIVRTTDISCSSEESGGASVLVNGGTPPYSYVWSNGATTPNLVDVKAGEYILEVIDSNGCSGEITATVNAAPNAIRIEDSIVTNVTGYLANDGSISLRISGGATPYTITWARASDGAIMGNENEIVDLSADSYQVTISDANGCTLHEAYEIIQPDIVEETVMQPTCGGYADGSIVVLINQGNGMFTYSWNTGATTNSIFELAPGSYTVTISGFGDGPITRTYVLEDPEPISVDLGPDRTLCAGQELVLNAMVADETAIYQWTTDSGGIISTAPTINVSETGNYYVTVQTITECLAYDDIYVASIDDEINAEFAVSSQVFVGESLIAVDISYPLPESIQWVVPEGGRILKEDSDEVEVVFSKVGEYEIGIMTSTGACSAQKTKKIIVVDKDESLDKEIPQKEKKQIVDFVIHPNPTSGRFTAQVGLSDRGDIGIKIFNFANNAMVASEKGQGKEAYAFSFDISGVPSGVYVVLLETPYGNTVRKIVIV
ncbi:T9SS type A sorting domain-containing protein [Kriegella aquimaris]|uniref:Por secretion system C-terminal sorting domain-containing protein n=1 Tax=Kriegella aquimaris TaxID=192904 RepID=A0A1G9LW43_9FLAO|nr:T9SS type A sorting domain-containing protein [Kriegella aquimaris]SDL66188.1 Por secretion system C-terminal sorting domain-containing protein [Kriegella aquimaris]